MTHRLLTCLTVGLVIAALAVPVAQAKEKYDGFKSGYPQVRQLYAYASTLSPYDGYKSGYPQLRFLETHQVVIPVLPAAGSRFDWPDAAIGAGTAAAAIFLLAGVALLYSRRPMRVGV
jgi:hypothetical protein